MLLDALAATAAITVSALTVILVVVILRLISLDVAGVMSPFIHAFHLWPLQAERRRRTGLTSRQ